MLPLAKRSELPFVVSFYGYDYEQLPHRKPVYKKRYRALFDHAEVLITEGPHGASILENMGCPPEKIRIVPLGVDVANIPFYKREKQAGSLHLLQAATFTEKKGYTYTIQALASLKEECPNIRLSLLGEKKDLSLVRELEDLIARADLEDRVQFLPFVSPTEFHEYLKNFDVFIHPSCYAQDRDCEGGAPVVLLDAQATGMPVITTRHCDIPSRIVEGKTAWLAAEKDIPQIAEGIRYFYNMESETYAEYTDNARRFVAEHFPIEAGGRTLAKVYSDLITAG